MASYRGLGIRQMTGAPDTTGKNTGNWTVVFDPSALNVNVPEFEIYKMIVHGAQNTVFDVGVDFYLWDTSIFGFKNSWDPSQPLLLKPGQTLYFYYSDPITDNTPPTVTLWLRYDASLFAGVM